jgi:ubiquinone biosynthesis protein
VTELIDAPSVDELLGQGLLDYDRLLELFRLHGFFMFVVGTFHGDLHPGNVLIRDGRFYFIDTGYIGTVGESLRRGLFRFFEALTRYDFEESAAALHEMSVRKLDRARLTGFRARFLELYRDFGGATVGEGTKVASAATDLPASRAVTRIGRPTTITGVGT